MPNAVTHVLIAIIIADIIRDYIIKDKKKFPLHYVLIAGIAGLLPDIDVIIYWILYYFGFSLSEVHRTFSHNLFVPLIFLILGAATLKIKSKKLGKHHLKFSIVFLMISLGTFLHLLLDALLIGKIIPFYPINNLTMGLNLIALTPFPSSIIAGIDAILLILWLWHEEVKHKISDFI